MAQSGMAPTTSAATGHLSTVPSSDEYIRRYALEREKRLGKGGVAQYFEPKSSTEFSELIEDPWIAEGTPVAPVDHNDGQRKVVIAGAGFGGILFAVNLIKNGFSTRDILIVDPAGGFGGTWYWNRYPGLRCDVESYIYMPMLEEMGYMPKHKYASGEEIRMYADSICQKYELLDTAMFQSTIQKAHWDTAHSCWDLEILQHPKRSKESSIRIKADFLILANGMLNNAKIPKMDGVRDFKGKMFHTARWNYEITGGTPIAPELTQLRDKRVAVIGTGATAVQVVPQLAKWAKELYIFQRTPAAVDERNNRETNPIEWKTKIATGPGWQRNRNFNFLEHVSNTDPKPGVDLVNDGWTSAPAFSALVGGPSYSVGMHNVAEHLQMLQTLDAPRAARIRERVAQTVRNQDTASKLQAWYPTWCKRPCFHDEYLNSFNQDNVTLVDTDGRGITRITPNGVEFDGREFEVDLLIWSTGFTSAGLGTVASRAGIDLIGRNGKSLDHQFRNGMSTLHGLMSRDFPNLFWPGPQQAASSANQAYVLELQCAQIAYIISAAFKRTKGTPIIQPTTEAQEAWSMRCLAGAATFAALPSCTPGWTNREGETDQMTLEEKMKSARQAIWSRGIVDYTRILEDWQREDKLEGLEVSARD